MLSMLAVGMMPARPALVPSRRIPALRAVISASMLPEEHLSRAKALLEAKDYAGAALEGDRALDSLPDLAEVSVVRGRALMLPLVEDFKSGRSVPDSLDFVEAFDAFRLALELDPNNKEAEMELERLGKLLKGLPQDAESKTSVESGTMPSSSSMSATPVRGVEVQEASAAASDADIDVIIVGAGAAGIGCAVSLVHTFGLDSSRVLLLERGEGVGTTFRMWPEEMRFISPSFNQAGWTNSFDLNSVAHGSSPAYSLGAQHPSGAQYADYLEELADLARIKHRVKRHTDVLQIVPVDGVFDVKMRTGGKDGEQREETMRARYVVWAAGEFQYPQECPCNMPGSELCEHNSHVRSWARLPGDDYVLIGGYESGVDAAVNLAKAGKQTTVIASTATWNVGTPDPSTELAPYTADRLREVTAESFSPRPNLLAPLRVQKVEKAADGGFNVIAHWKAAETQRPFGRQPLRKPFADSTPAGAEGSELVVHTANPPILCTGFEGSVASLKGPACHLFNLAAASDAAKGCLAGAPLLTKEDESTKVPGVFLVGPSVSHGELSFCFVYKFRQRFGIVSNAICSGLGLDTAAAVEEARRTNMYLDDLSCCEGACGEVC